MRSNPKTCCIKGCPFYKICKNIFHDHDCVCDCECECDSYESDYGQRITFHRIPKKAAVREKWMSKVGRMEGRHIFVCSRHFKDSDFTTNVHGCRLLRRSAVPCIPEDELEEMTEGKVLKSMLHDHCYAKEEVDPIWFDHGHYCLHGNKKVKQQTVCQTDRSRVLTVDGAMQPVAQASGNFGTDDSNLTAINEIEADAIHPLQLQNNVLKPLEEIESSTTQKAHFQATDFMPPSMHQTQGKENMRRIEKDNLLQNVALTFNSQQLGHTQGHQCTRTRSEHEMNTQVHESLNSSTVSQTRDLGHQSNVKCDSRKKDARMDLQDGGKSQVNTSFVCIPVYVPVPCLPLYDHNPFDPFPVVQHSLPQINWGPPISPLGTNSSVEAYGNFDIRSCGVSNIGNCGPYM